MILTALVLIALGLYALSYIMSSTATSRDREVDPSEYTQYNHKRSKEDYD